MLRLFSGARLCGAVWSIIASCQLEPPKDQLGYASRKLQGNNGGYDNGGDLHGDAPWLTLLMQKPICGRDL